jgi:hypothetical protein
MSGTFAEQEMIEGYLDGRIDERQELPDLSNRSGAYIHGWRNGRDDRTRKPRASIRILRMEADAALKEGS